jgi:hypothetical protein
MIFSAPIKPEQPSVRTEEMKPHRINPIDRNGKKSVIGVLKIPPNTKPIVPIITPILMVNQNGPNEERL